MGISRLGAVVIASLVVPRPVPALADGGARPGAAPDPELIFKQATLCVLPDAQNGWRPCVGLDRDALSYRDFYLIAGRKALADDDERRWWRRQILMGSGVGATVLGTLSLVPLAAGKRWIPVPISLGAIAGGLVLSLLGSRVSQDPSIDSTEATDLARRYNLRLREQLGLPPLDRTQVVLGVGLRRSF